MDFVPVNKPMLGEEETTEISKIIQSGALTHKEGKGKYVLKFEESFAKFIGTKHAIAVNSGTAALHSALLALNLDPKDEIIVPTFTFVATAEVVLHVGCKVVFSDINPRTFNIDLSTIQKKVTNRTKAIIAVHLYGHPVDLNPILEFAKDKEIAVIEDVAQAHGGTYYGKMVGSLGDFGCFSFYPSKNMTTGEGGMITTNSSELADKLRMIRNHGESEEYKTVVLGHNFRMPELSAAIGDIQLKKLKDFLTKRATNAEILNNALQDVETINIPIVEEWATHAWYLYTTTLKDPTKRNDLIAKLRKENIGTGVYYSTPLHLMPLFQKLYGFKGGEFLNSEKASKSVLSLPVYPGINKEQMEFIANKTREVCLSL
ncbi:MAG: DegT/DnrJ/EryC1/StrS aminotransferase family protein [Candidatus Helarchaeota archaeon]|nr:DegT/DnrJ/EryC1/StrS aminotransferase family protein [Candidatus Helarchaeota archaeon]